MDVAEVQEITPSVSDNRKFTAIRKRFQDPVSPHVPALLLGVDGVIQHTTPAARHMLEYKSDQPIEPCFFSHVHGRNLYQVMRDVADMVCYGKASASWLLRLRTGQGRWRWYKASVKNQLNLGEGTILINLRDLHDW